MAEKGIANLEILGSGDKRLICTAFLVTLDRINKFLPIQLIYDGKATGIMASIDFPSSLSLI